MVVLVVVIQMEWDGIPTRLIIILFSIAQPIITIPKELTNSSEIGSTSNFMISDNSA